MTNFVIYALVDPRTNEVRYVGQTKVGAKRRLRGHLCRSHLSVQSHKNNWLKELMAEGLRPHMAILEDVGSREGLNSAEIRHIARQKANGAQLTNITDGGEAKAGWTTPLSTKRKMSIAQGGLSEEQARKAISMYQDGLSLSAIGTAMGVSDQAIRSELKRAGVAARSLSEAVKKLWPHQEQELEEFYAVGRSMKWLGRHFDVSCVTVSNILRRRGVRLRTISEARRAAPSLVSSAP